MLQGKREADWNHTAALMLAIQRSAGNKNAQFRNPFASSYGGDQAKWNDMKRKRRNV